MKKPLLISYSRFSSPEQSKGDSLRRQIEAAQEYAKANGFTFDQSISDEGISAFKGKHASEGGFSKFLEMVKAGKVPVGSLLYVEAMDRLSRQAPAKAVSQLMDIINAGITVYTAMDGQTYNTDILNNNIGSFYLSISAIYNAHTESDNKSKRLQAAWKQKRKLAALEKKPVSNRCPAWMILNSKTGQYELIPERAALIKRIFHLNVQGYGETAITQTLNTEGVKPWGKPKTAGFQPRWNQSYIRKVLSNPAVYGLYQPTKVNDNGNRLPEGEPIENYYPAAIEKDFFFKAKEIRSTRGGTPGRSNKARNLFSHITKCGECGGPMNSTCKVKDAIVDGKKTRVTLRYFQCEAARTKSPQCNHKLKFFPLEHFEKAFLTMCTEIKPSDILDTESEKAVEIATLENKAATTRAAIQEKDMAISNYTSQFEKAVSDQLKDLMATNLDKALTAKTEFEKELEQITGNISTLKTQETAVEEHLKSISELFKRLEDPKHEEKTRYKLRQVIRQFVDRILLFPDGMHDQYFNTHGKSPELITVSDLFYKKKALEYVNQLVDRVHLLPNGMYDRVFDSNGKTLELIPGIADDKKQIHEYIKENTGKTARAAIVYFKTGSAKAIYYNPRRGYYLGERHDQEQIDQDRAAIEQITQHAGSFIDKLHSALDHIENKPKPNSQRIVYNPDPDLSALLELEDRIKDMKASGIKYQAIADKLNAEGYVTARGKPWTFSNVSRICNRK